MEYDFDQLTDRHGSCSYKWDIDGSQDVIEMWVADMDFPAAPAIRAALQRRLDHGIFGYASVPESYYEAVIAWFQHRHGWTIAREHIIYTSGVVPATSCVIKALSMPGEKVLLQTPAYNCFFSSIRNNGCEVFATPLHRTADSYEPDWDDMERRCADEKTTLFILCNPHNPSGRVWTRAELERMRNICHRYHVQIVSDEIHCELTHPNIEYVPFATIDPTAITLCSPTKAFNIAGLQIANIICPDNEQRRRIDRAININEVCDVNPFGIVALQAAYNESAEWLDAMRHYIWNNYDALKTFIQKELPAIKVLRLEGTYLPWLDIRATGLSSEEAAQILLQKGRVRVSPGTLYSPDDGEGYLRLNIACPRTTMMEGLQRMVDVLKLHFCNVDITK